MTHRSESGDAADSTAAVPAPPFDRLIETHGAAASAFRRMIWLFLALGLTLAGIGVMAEGWRWLAAAGAVLALSALTPWKKAAEHGERAEGLAVLKEEWADAAPGAGAERLRRLIFDLYGASQASQHEPEAKPT